MNPTNPQFPTSNVRVVPAGDPEYNKMKNDSATSFAALTKSGEIAKYIESTIDKGTPAQTVKINGEGY